MNSSLSAASSTNVTVIDGGLVSYFHHYPRILGASNQFEVTVGYFAGVGYTIIPYVAVALFFLVVGLVFLCVPWRALLCLPSRPVTSAYTAEPATFFYAKDAKRDGKEAEPFSDEDSSVGPSAPTLEQPMFSRPEAAPSCRFFPPPLCSVYIVSVSIGLVLLAAAAAIALGGVIVSHNSLDDTLDIVHQGSQSVRQQGKFVVALYTNASGLLQALIPRLALIAPASSLSGLNVSDIPAQAEQIYQDVVNVLDDLDNGLGSVHLAESIHFGLMLACAIVLLVLAFLTALAVYLSCHYALQREAAEASWTSNEEPPAPVALRRTYRRHVWRIRLALCAPVLFVALSWVGLGVSVAYGVLNGDLCTAASARQIQLLHGENIHGNTGGPDHVSSHSLDHLIYCPAVTSLTNVLNEQQSDLDKVSAALYPTLHRNLTLENYQEVIQTFEASGGVLADLLRGDLSEGEQILSMLSNGTKILERWRACGPVLNILAGALQEQCNSGIQAALVAFIGFIMCVALSSIIAFYVVGCSKAQNKAIGL
ncbi:hypothetical protein CCYA_CCYA10G2773 [Cyanidiococcus yangmingshanensis]|nr:hypothetical protein CCYA_CCYA10G2773 [Cyanidiococcus yangmingshanensis]